MNKKADASVKYKTKATGKEELYLVCAIKKNNQTLFMNFLNVYLKNPIDDVKIKAKVKKPKQPSLFLCLCKAFAGKFIAGAFLKFVQDIILFAGPILLAYDRNKHFLYK